VRPNPDKEVVAVVEEVEEEGVFEIRIGVVEQGWGWL